MRRVRDSLGGPFRTPHAKWGAGAQAASVAPDLASGVLIGPTQLSRTPMRPWVSLAAALVVGALVSSATAQTTSLAERQPATEPVVGPGREEAGHRGNPTLETHSLIAVAVQPPKTFRVHDLITIIVRQQTQYESDGMLNSKRKLEVESTVDAFIAFIDGGIGASAFRRGKPNIDYELETNLKNKARKDREDRLTTRITARIIDVKPNGNLVLEARARQRFDNELSTITLTGTCRSSDVTPDNALLSTQLADLNLTVKNEGAVRDGTRRGWLYRLIDRNKPF